MHNAQLSNVGSEDHAAKANTTQTPLPIQTLSLFLR